MKTTQYPAQTANAPNHRLHRTLNFRDLVVYGLLFIAPMAPVGIFGTLYANSYGAVALVYVLATVAMAFTAFSYAQMVRVAPQAGSVFAYARAGLGQGAGFIAGWMMMLDYLLIPAVAYLFSGIALHALIPSISTWIFTTLAVVVTTILNLWGVRMAALVGFLVLVMEILVLLIFIVSAVVILIQNGSIHSWASPFIGQGHFSVAALFSGVSVAILSYLGFDAIAAFAEENIGGSRQIGRAVLFCLTLAGVLFIAQTYLIALLTHDSAATLAANPAKQGVAFYGAVEAGIGHWLHQLVAISKATGAAFAALTGQAAGGRLLFAMARDRRLPRILAKVDKTSGVPRHALLIAASITLIAAVWAARHADGLSQLVSLVDVGALSAFALLHLSVIGWFMLRNRDGSRNWCKHLLIPLLGLAVTIAVITGASHVAQWIGLVWLAMGLMILWVQRGSRVGNAIDTAIS